MLKTTVEICSNNPKRKILTYREILLESGIYRPVERDPGETYNKSIRIVITQDLKLFIDLDHSGGFESLSPSSWKKEKFEKIEGEEITVTFKNS